MFYLLIVPYNKACVQIEQAVSSLDGVIDELSKYYEEDYAFSNSTIYKNLEKWYTNTLDSYGDYIAYYKYCNDYVLDDDNYLAYNNY